MVTRKKEDETQPEKKPAAAKKVAADKPVKKAPAASKAAKSTKAPATKAATAVAPTTTTSLVFQAPDPGLFPTWTPGPETQDGGPVVRKRSRANRKPLDEDKKSSESSSDSSRPQ